MHDLFLAVCGRPIFHSKSPVIFKQIFKKSSVAGTYFRILNNDANDVIELCKKLNLNGVNATSPLKENLYEIIEQKDNHAANAKSINALKNNSGKLSGFSTDHFGVLNSLKQIVDIKDKMILVIGAGGAAKAAVYGLSDYTNNITIVNRTKEKAENMADFFDCKFDEYDNIKKIANNFDVIISTLPSNIVPFCSDDISSKPVLFDANYKGSYLKTISEKNGNIFISGENWLINQAFPGYEIFSGEKSPDIEIDISRDILYDKSLIFLTGFMCSGKSSVGIELAKIMNYRFIDMDALIEEKENLTISEIFEKYGESHFRKLEEKLLEDLMSERNCIVSTGGGVILSEKSQKILSQNLTIWIFSDIQESISRDDGTRPLLKTENIFQSFITRFESRKKLYADTCSFMIYNNKSIDRIADILNEEISRIK